MWHLKNALLAPDSSLSGTSHAVKQIKQEENFGTVLQKRGLARRRANHVAHFSEDALSAAPHAQAFPCWFMKPCVPDIDPGPPRPSSSTREQPSFLCLTECHGIILSWCLLGCCPVSCWLRGQWGARRRRRCWNRSPTSWCERRTVWWSALGWRSSTDSNFRTITTYGLKIPLKVNI